MSARRHSRRTRRASLLLSALAISSLTSASLLCSGALAEGDPADAWEPEAQRLDDPIVPRRSRRAPVEPVESRVLPEPQLHPAALADDDKRDPADRANELEPREHVPPGPSSLSSDVDCAEETSERRSRGPEGAEIGCVDDRGRRHGPWLRLWDNGAPRVRGFYEGGRRHGVFTTWHLSGRLERRAAYARGLRQGTEQLWYESGRRKAETGFKDDLEHGTQQLYFESGQLRVKGQHSMGTPVGRWLWFAEDGSLLRERDYDSVGEVLTEKLGAPAAPPTARPVAVASAAGGAGGALLGVPLALLIGAAAASGGSPAVGLLIFFALPPLIAGLGAAIGAALFSPMPFPVVVGVASAGSMPFGALAGATGGLVVTALLFSDTGIADTAVWGGLLVGACVGAVTAPAAVGALTSWFFAPAAGASE